MECRQVNRRLQRGSAFKRIGSRSNRSVPVLGHSNVRPVVVSELGSAFPLGKLLRPDGRTPGFSNCFQFALLENTCRDGMITSCCNCNDLKCHIEPGFNASTRSAAPPTR